MRKIYNLKEIALLARVVAVTLVVPFTLAGCSDNPPEPAPTASVVPTTEAVVGADSAVGSDNAVVGESATKKSDIPQATYDYVDCLNRNGVGAEVGSIGEILKPLGDGEKVKNVSAGSEESPDPVEEICQKEVPEYTPLDLNEK